MRTERRPNERTSLRKGSGTHDALRKRHEHVMSRCKTITGKSKNIYRFARRDERDERCIHGETARSSSRFQNRHSTRRRRMTRRVTPTLTPALVPPSHPLLQHDAPLRVSSTKKGTKNETHHSIGCRQTCRQLERGLVCGADLSCSD